MVLILKLSVSLFCIAFIFNIYIEIDLQALINSLMNKTELKCLFLDVHWQLTPQYITVSVMSYVMSSIFALTSVLGNGTIMFVT